MKLLHIIATPRKQGSHTLQVADAFLESLQAKYPALSTEVMDLFDRDLPAVDGDNIESKYTLMVGKRIDKRHQESWKHIEILIEHFLSADIYLLSVPMWNFGIPYPLKYYIDAIVQPTYLFTFNEQGQAVGLVHNKKMVCITSRGGNYSEQSPFHAYDFQEPYLRAIFGYVGISDIHFVNAQPMDVTLQLRETAMSAAIKEARDLASSLDCDEVQSAIPNPLGVKPPPI